MAFFISCLSCGARVRAPDKAAGRSFKCPKCGDLLRAPPPAPPPPQRSSTPQAISVNCPHCLTKLSIEADSVGKMASCPMCGGSFPLSTTGGAPSPQTEAIHEDSPRSEEPEEQESEERELDERELDEQVLPLYDDEPWFYGHLENYAKGLQSMGYILAGGCAVLTTLGFFWAWGAISPWIPGDGIGVKTVLISLLGWVFMLVWIVAMLRLWMVGVAAILLAVDAARNLRAMKNAPPNAPISK